MPGEGLTRGTHNMSDAAERTEGGPGDMISNGFYVSPRGRAGLAPILHRCFYLRENCYPRGVAEPPRLVLAYSRPTQHTEYGVMSIATAQLNVHTQTIDVPAHGRDAGARVLKALWGLRHKYAHKDTLFVLASCENVCNPSDHSTEDPEFMKNLHHCITSPLEASTGAPHGTPPLGFHVVVACLGMPPSRMSPGNLRISGAYAVYFDEPRDDARRQIITNILDRQQREVSNSRILSPRFVIECREDLVEFLVDCSRYHSVGEIEDFFVQAWGAMMNKMYAPDGQFVKLAPAEPLRIGREFYGDLMMGGHSMVLDYDPDKTEDPYREYARIEISDKREYRAKEAERMRERRKRQGDMLSMFSDGDAGPKRAKTLGDIVVESMVYEEEEEEEEEAMKH